MRTLPLVLLFLLAQGVVAQIPLPPEIGGRSITPIDNPSPNALVELEDLLALYASEADAEHFDSDQPLPLSVQRLYAQARLQALMGNNSDAAILLGHAIERAPDNARLRHELALALIADGRVDEARKEVDRALALGADNARLLYIAGSLAARDGDLIRAQELLLRVAAEPIGEDALAALVHFALAEVLTSRGYLLAGAQATVRAAEHTQHIRAHSVYGNELARAYETRAARLEQAADTLMRLVRPAQAAHAYALAREMGASVITPVVCKQIAALISAQQADEAASVLIEACTSPSYRMDERLIRCVDLFASEQRAQIADALIPLRHEPWCVRGARAWLDRVIARASPPEDARDLLREILRADPTHAHAMIDLLRSHDSDAARARELVALIADDPRLLTTIEQVARLTRATPPEQILADAPSIEARLARAILLIATDRAEEARRILHEEDPTDQRVRQVRALAAIRAGRLHEVPPPPLPHERNHPARQAWAMIYAAARDHDAVVHLLSGMNAPDEETLYLTLWLRTVGAGAPIPSIRTKALRLLELDPAHPEALETLARLSRSDPDLGARIGTIFREQYGGLRLRRILACEQLITRGDRATAENLLSDLVLEQDEPDRALELLARLWMTAPDSQREPALTRGVRFCDRLLEDRPPSTRLLLTHAQLLSQLGRHQEAIASLEASPDARVQRTREGLMLRDAELADHTRQLRRDRLARTNLSLDERAERIAAACEEGDLIGAIDRVDSSIPDGVTLDAWQSRIIADALSTPAAEIARDPEGPLATPYTGLVRRLLDHDCTLTTDLLRLHLALLAQRDASPVDALGRTSVDVAWRVPDAGSREQLAMTPVRVLASRGALGEALSLIEQIAEEIEIRDPRYVELWTGLVVQAGDAKNTERMLDAVRSDQALRAVFSSASFGDINELRGPLLRAEVAFQIGTAHASIGKPDAAEGDYRLGLTLNPRHPWCANNLGYGLLETGGDLNEAEHLITIAHEQVPDNGSIIDSMGWVRYLRGQIEDEVDAQGRIVREGAVTLLSRAAELGGEDAGAVVLDHLGDALWRAERHEEAIAAWRRALEAARGEHEALAQTAPPEHPDLVELEGLLEALEAKIASAQDGGSPPIAPIANELSTP